MKEKCTNHPQKNALSFCHSCGKYFCDTCLVEGERYYYCNNNSCQKIKTKEEKNIKKNNVEENSIILTSSNRRISPFFKHTLIYLCLSFPIYLLAITIVADSQLKSIGILLLMTLIACGKSIIANFLVGFTLYKLFVKVDDTIIELRLNSIIISIISFFIYIHSMEKIKDIDIVNNAIIVLSFVVSVITFLIFNMIFLVHKKRSNGTLDDLNR